jgi:chemotaxis signal transduction protein
MKNVIVFALGGERYAAELRWVREVITLGFVTAVPTAPLVIGGVVNLHGAITPLIDLHALLAETGDAPTGDEPTGDEPEVLSGGPRARQGDGALLLEVDGTTAALPVDNVDAVATLNPTPDGSAVLDGRGRFVPLIDPPALLQRALAAVQAVRELAHGAAVAAAGGSGAVLAAAPIAAQGTPPGGTRGSDRGA